MKIKWRVTLGLVFQCVLVIILFSAITMVQLKDNIMNDSSQLNAKISDQTLISFSYISDDIEGYLFNICRSDSITSAIMAPEETYSSSVVLDRFLYSLAESTDYIAGAYIVDEEHDRFYGYSKPRSSVTEKEAETLYKDGFFDIRHDTQWCSDAEGNVYIRRDIYNSYPYKKIGYIVANISTPEFLALIGINSNSEETICIFCDDGELIVDGSNSTVSKELLTDAYSVGTLHRESVTDFEYDGEIYDVYMHGIQGWSVMHLMLQKDKLSTYLTMNSTIRIVGIVLCVLSIFLASIISHSLLKNVNSMMKQVQLIGDGQVNRKIVINSSDEIGELANSFNQLFTKLDAVNERIIAEGLEKEKIKYELLNLRLRSVQAQIAPHFIGNLLGALNSYAAVGQTDKVESLSVHASNYLRNNVKSSDRKYSTLEEEFRAIDDYIAMYQDIFGQPETYEAAFEQEECREMLVPSMLIQPMIENSLKYFSTNGGCSTANIKMRARHIGGRLELSIEDTSGAFPDDVLIALEKLKNTGEDQDHRLGYGLTGTIRRLSLIYDRDYDFRIIQSEEFKKTIIVNIPVKNNSN